MHSLFVYCMRSFLAYFCQSDVQCNNKGICQNGTCECQPGWEKKLDCTGIKIKIFYDLVLEIGFTLNQGFIIFPIRHGKRKLWSIFEPLS